MGKLEALHENLFKSGLSLDVKTLLEQDFSERRRKLNGLYEKQKNINQKQYHLLGLFFLFQYPAAENV